MKKTIETEWRVLVEPRKLGNFGFARMSDRLVSDNIARDYKDRCDEIVNQIKRHVDNVGWVGVDVVTKEVCEFCGYPWTEEGPYNGGCCSKDEEIYQATLSQPPTQSG